MIATRVEALPGGRFATPIALPSEPPVVRDGLIRAVISTATPDRAGDLVVPGGLLNAAEFARNPVVLWSHQRTLPPIGTCTKLEVHEDRIVAETRFSTASKLAQEVYQLYAEGILRAWSIGFRPRRVFPRGKQGLRIESWELLEYSAVAVPENAEALSLAMSKGQLEAPEWRGWLERADVLAGLL